MFGSSWKRWENCNEWQQEWFNKPHVASWLNDGRYDQDPGESNTRPPIKSVPSAEPYAVRAERERKERIVSERLRSLVDEERRRQPQLSPREEYARSVAGGDK